MGIYVFETEFLFEQLRRDVATPGSNRDFGGDIIPYIVKHGKAVAHRFTDSCIRAAEQIEEYWRDRGYTVDVKLVDAGFVAAMRSARTDVRSDMVNGFPTKRAANERERANLGDRSILHVLFLLATVLPEPCRAVLARVTSVSAGGAAADRP